MANPKILIAEDDDTIRQVTEAVLRREGYETIGVPDAEQAVEILQRFQVDLVITDLHLPGASGLELIRKVRSIYSDTAAIIVTAFGTIQSAVDAMKSGAYDYLTKPILQDELKAVVHRALEHHRLIEEVDLLRSCLDQKYGFERIIGSSASLTRTLDMAARVAPADVTVLLRGETGTGKELIAKAIHFRSPRRNRPFVTINCGAIPRDLLESELFGHMRGSFTGAMSHKKGKAEAADGGTIFLDEIGEMPLELQVKVLRLIQEHEIEKIGVTKPLKLDLRIIAATHRDLGAMVKSGSFREDLFYRLMVVPIEVPPLRERPDDIPVLTQYFFSQYKLKYGRMELTLPFDIMHHFARYAWPGNVRQLQSSVERTVLLAKGPHLTVDDLPECLRNLEPEPEVLPKVLPEAGVNLAAWEKDLITRTLQKFDGNQSRAARFLHVSRRTLAYRLDKYGISLAERSRTTHQSAAGQGNLSFH